MLKTVTKRSRKETEIDRLSQVAAMAASVLGKTMAEVKDLQQVNLGLNTLRVNTWHALSAEREALIARIHAVDCLIHTLGMNGPAKEQK